MEGNNENDTEEIINFNESAVMSGLEVHSTPNVGQDKIVELSVTDETKMTEDSGCLLYTSKKCSFNNPVENQ